MLVAGLADEEQLAARRHLPGGGVVAARHRPTLGVAAQQPGMLTEQRARVQWPVPAGAHERVGTQRRRGVGERVEQLHLDRVPGVAGTEHAGAAVPHEPFAPEPSVAILEVVQGLQRRGRDDRVVRAGVQRIDPRPLRLGRVEQRIDGFRIEDAVDVRRGVGGRVPEPPVHGVHPRVVSEQAAQVQHDLGGALPAADDDHVAHAPRVEAVGPEQVLAGVPDPRAGPHLRGEPGLQPGGEHDVPDPAGHASLAGDAFRTVHTADVDVVAGDGAVDEHGGHRLHPGAVGDVVAQLGGGPAQVLDELHPQRAHRAAVDEVGEPRALGEELQEREVRARITHRRKVLRERHLHRGVLEQHAFVPAGARRRVDERRPQRPGALRGPNLVGLPQRDRQRHVRRPESDSQHVERLARTGLPAAGFGAGRRTGSRRTRVRADASPGDLADGRRRQVGDDAEAVGHLERRERLREQVSAQHPPVQRDVAIGLVRARHDVGDEPLPEQVVGLPDDARVVHPGVPQERVLDLGRRDLLTAAVDLLLGAPDDRDAAGRVTTHEVTGAVEAVGGERGLLARPTEVIAADRVRPAHLQLADRTGRHLDDIGA